MHAETLEDVVAIMDQIIDDSFSNQSRLGYFAALYRTVTLVVKDFCDRGGYFDDADRMRYIDVIFANRYFEALAAYQQTSPTSDVWTVAFDSVKQKNLLILQHLFLGMNAHIILDLGIITAEIEGGKLSPSLERDFYRINDILLILTHSILAQIAQASPMFNHINKLPGEPAAKFVGFVVTAAREQAWNFAQELCVVPQDSWESSILRRDKIAASFSRNVIKNMSWYLAPAMWFVNRRESDDTVLALNALCDKTWIEMVQLDLAGLLMKNAHVTVEERRAEAAQYNIKMRA